MVLRTIAPPHQAFCTFFCLSICGRNVSFLRREHLGSCLSQKLMLSILAAEDQIKFHYHSPLKEMDLSEVTF